VSIRDGKCLVRGKPINIITDARDRTFISTWCKSCDENHKWRYQRGYLQACLIGRFGHQNDLEFVSWSVTKAVCLSASLNGNAPKAAQLETAPILPLCCIGGSQDVQEAARGFVSRARTLTKRIMIAAARLVQGSN